MKNMQICLKGVRGTLPMHAVSHTQYGGATSCVYVKVGNESFILDAGTGLGSEDFTKFSPKSHFTMLISHSHVDHLMGFPTFSPLFDPKWSGDVCLRTRDGKDARTQIEALMSPPLWPIRTDVLRADLRFREPDKCFTVGDVTVETLEVTHPGGCTAYKLTCGESSLVYATDYEVGNDEADFIEFAKDCTLLLVDAQYTHEEYATKRGFGHSTVEHSISLACKCGAKNTIFIHHDPSRTDAVLKQWDELLAKQHPTIHFGREGEEVFI